MEEPTQMQTPDNEAMHTTDNTNQEPKEAPVAPESVEDTQHETAAEPVAQENTDAPAAEPAEEPSPAEEPEASPAAEQESGDAEVAEDEVAEPEVSYDGHTREQLIDDLQQLLQNDIQAIHRRVMAVRQRFTALTKEVEREAYERFLAEGGVKEQYQTVADELSTRFFALVDSYKQRRQQYKDALEQQKEQNYEAKKQTLDELRQLIDSDEETLKQLYDRFYTIQEKWKTIGEVPREHLNDLWQNYHLLVEKFFNKVNINKELRMLDLKRNLEEKVQLCEKAEELIVEESTVKAIKLINQLRDRWREIGPVPDEQNEEIWQRFRNAVSQIEARRKEYYEQRKDEMDKNLLAKQELVAQMRELTQTVPETTAQWNATTQKVDDMLKLWKSIGPVPRDVNEEIWSQFKGMIDAFYETKKAHFNTMRDEQTENYNRKIELCLKAEAIAMRDDWKRATEELLQLQAEWKSIGPTSRKVSEKVWHRFRSACDDFFRRKGEYFKNMRSSESENLAKKQEILDKLKSYEFGNDKEENLRVIKEFQRQWMEIGHVPIAEKDRLQKEFRDTINAHFEKLKISAREAAEDAYRERVQAGSGDKRFVSSERQQLTEKIEKLKASVKLWENNLGFLASSRSADLLKEEFEKKMQATRQQIALLEAKLKILNRSEKEEKSAEGAKEENGAE
ncbi:MAG: DUF349 domain-containing protein [Bacteroidales bacterium]|nr:DUF349 domain-containing protein [Bacteroidales bacterium]